MAQIAAAAHHPAVRLRLPIGAEHIGGPFPGIAGHIVQPVAVGCETVRRRQAKIPVLGRVLRREHALPDIALPGAVHLRRIAPGIAHTFQPTARRLFPFRLGWQPFAGPGAKRQRVAMRHMHHRQPVAAGQVGVRPMRMPPIRPEHLPPPRRRRHCGGRFEIIRQQAGEHERPAEAFRFRHIAGGGNKAGEARIGDRQPIHPKRRHLHQA